jgi:hypothetical protein
VTCSTSNFTRRAEFVGRSPASLAPSSPASSTSIHASGAPTISSYWSSATIRGFNTIHVAQGGHVGLTLALALEPRGEPGLTAKHDLAHALPRAVGVAAELCGARTGEIKALRAERGIEGERLVDGVREERGEVQDRGHASPQLPRERREQRVHELALSAAC